MKQVIGYSWMQLNTPHTNQKPLVAERLAASHERMRFVDICMIAPCPDSGKELTPFSYLWYNSVNRIERNAPAQRKLPGAWVTSWRLATMNNSSIPHSESQPIDDPRPEFDIPIGQMVVRVEDADNINVVFSPPIACVMRDPDGQDRPVYLTDTDDLIARVFAGWTMVGVA